VGPVYATVGKRATDVVIGAVLCVVAVPVIALLAILSAVALRCWPFFVQDRVGRRGHVIRFPKIRTLPKNAAAAADKRAIADIPIPRLSAFLRKTHLDELPQLFCVVIGSLSLVGPRPEMPDILTRYSRAFADARGQVRPGCTGLWQVSVASTGMIYEAPQYDEYYVAHRTFALDVWILWRTVVSTLRPDHRVALDALPARFARPTATPEPSGIHVVHTSERVEAVNGSAYTIDLTIVERPILVAGAGGFIGGHLVQHLLQTGAWVRAIDAKPLDEWHQLDRRAENLMLDLRDPSACHDAAEGVGTIYNLAADTGGVVFAERNGAPGMLSVLLNTHLLTAARDAGVARFFFASSASVYGDGERGGSAAERREADAYGQWPVDGAGWEKLFSERLCRQFREDYGIETRVARYANIYGPCSTLEGDREAAPAAICRKVAEAAASGLAEIEIWGDGEQTRSFLYVDDCIAGTEMLMAADLVDPVNLGASEPVSINRLVDVVEDIAGVALRRRYLADGPVGPQFGNTDSSLARAELGWKPTVSLEEGLESTYRWVFDRVRARGYVGA